MTKGAVVYVTKIIGMIPEIRTASCYKHILEFKTAPEEKTKFKYCKQRNFERSSSASKFATVDSAYDMKISTHWERN